MFTHPNLIFRISAGAGDRGRLRTRAGRRCRTEIMHRCFVRHGEQEHRSCQPVRQLGLSPVLWGVTGFDSEGRLKPVT